MLDLLYYFNFRFTGLHYSINEVSCDNILFKSLFIMVIHVLQKGIGQYNFKFVVDKCILAQ